MPLNGIGRRLGEPYDKGTFSSGFLDRLGQIMF